MSKPSAFLIIIFICCISPVQADDISGRLVRLDLKTALKMAAAQNPSVLIARDSVQQMIARMDDKKSILYPQITADVSERRRTTDLRSSGMTFANTGDPLIGPYNVFDARVKVTQKLFDPELKNRLDWLRDGKMVSEIQQEKVREDILALAAAQYIQAVRGRQMLKLMRAMLSRDYHQLRMVQKQFQIGMATEVGLRQAQTQYLQTLQQGRDARRAFMKSRMDLAATLGLEPDQKMILEEWNADAFLAYALIDGEWISADIRLAEAKVRQSQQLIASEQSERWPKLTMGADYGVAGESPASKNSSETYALQVEASFPVFDAGARRNRVKAAQSEQQMNETGLQDVRRRTDMDIMFNRQLMTDARAAMRQAEMQQRLAQSRLEVARRQWRIGAGDWIEFLSSRAGMAGAGDQRREAEALYLMSAVNLAHATGNLERWMKAE